MLCFQPLCTLSSVRFLSVVATGKEQTAVSACSSHVDSASLLLTRSERAVSPPASLKKHGHRRYVKTRIAHLLLNPEFAFKLLYRLIAHTEYEKMFQNDKIATHQYEFCMCQYL